MPALAAVSPKRAMGPGISVSVLGFEGMGFVVWEFTLEKCCAHAGVVASVPAVLVQSLCCHG